MKNSENSQKIWIKFILIIFLIFCVFVIWVTSFFNINKQQSERHFAIIPHFMLDSEKVDQFYQLIDSKYYSNWDKPDIILLISPNHFHAEENNIETICDSTILKYQSNYVNTSSKLSSLWVKCDNNEKIFYSRWETLQTYEHGIWEHFKYIEKYFSDSQVIPIITPSFKFSAVDNILPSIRHLKGNILVIASVDFAHYQPEKMTLENDERSIETLKSSTINKWEIANWIDADCPACLYLIQYLANEQWQKPELWWRDSSSTILWEDMWEENTSRIFMWYE